MLCAQVVEYNGTYFATARTAYMKTIAGRWWWLNAAYICSSRHRSFTSPHCIRFDPWHGTFKECLWSGLVDTRGVEDPKLFVWPGKGVYAIFGRKPAAVAGMALCSKTEPWLQQYLVSVVVEPTAGEWLLRQPVGLHVTIPGYYDAAVKAGSVIKEKNWMPLVYEQQLYVVYSILPQHTVLRVMPDGSATDQFVTDNSLTAQRFNDKDMHGGPPVVLIPESLTRTNTSYYLGIMHYYQWEKSELQDIKHYHHFAYRMQAQPPFCVCAISKEVPLVFRKSRMGASRVGSSLKNIADAFRHQRIWKDTSHTAYINGLYLEAGGGGYEGARLLISYGSSDIDARLVVMRLSQLDALFESQQHVC